MIIINTYLFFHYCSFGELPSEAKLIISSEKLIKEGFSFNYSMEDIYDQIVDYLKAKGLLQS